MLNRPEILNMNMHAKFSYSITCNAGILFWESARANISNFKSRGRLGMVESVTKGVGIRLKGKWIVIPNLAALSYPLSPAP